MLKNRSYAPAFTVAQIAKDFDIMIDTGRAKNIPMPMTSLIRQFWSTMMAMGKGDQDFFSLITLLEQMAGKK